MQKLNIESKTNQEILSELDNICGAEECKKVLESYAMYLTLKKNKKMDFGTCNIMIKNPIESETSEQIIDVISKLLKANNIVSTKYRYLSEDEVREDRKKENKSGNRKSKNNVKNQSQKNKEIKEDILIIDSKKLGGRLYGTETKIVEMMKLYKDKVFILVDAERFGGWDIEDFDNCIIWKLNVEEFSKKDKEKYIKNFLEKNSIKIDKKCVLLNTLSNKKYEELKEEILNIVVRSKAHEIDKISNENIKETERVVKAAGDYDVAVEAELGRIPGFEDLVFSGHAEYTDPEAALKFVQETNCTSLAISAGTSHGGVMAEDYLPFSFEVLKSIHEKLPSFPLVLHGAASSPPDLIDRVNKLGGTVPYMRNCAESDIAKCGELGICKANMDVDNFLCFTEGVRRNLLEHSDLYDPRKYLEDGEKGYSLPHTRQGSGNQCPHPAGREAKEGQTEETAGAAGPGRSFSSGQGSRWTGSCPERAVRPGEDQEEERAKEASGRDSCRRSGPEYRDRPEPGHSGSFGKEKRKRQENRKRKHRRRTGEHSTCGRSGTGNCS